MCKSSIPLLPGPGLTAPNEWELHQAEQPKEAMFTRRVSYPAFCQTAFSEKDRKRKSLPPNTYIKIFQINSTSSILKWNYTGHFFFFFKGTDVHRRSNTCIMSEVCILIKILFKNRADCDVPRPLYLECRQHLLLYLNRNTSSLPSPPNLLALQINLGLEAQTQFFLYSLSITTTHHQYYRPSHSLSCTCLAWPKLNQIQWFPEEYIYTT